MRKLVALGWGIAVAAACALVDRPAEACGGCFHPVAPRQVTVVTGHRMAFSVSPQQTVLWDQIQYSGEPQDFAWVLPVRPGAQIQLSHDELFEALDALTDPVITGPTPNCSNGSAPAFGCGSSSSSASAEFGGASPSDSNNGNTVQVLSEGVVGPYEQVTLHSSNPNALTDWLQANSYDIPTSIAPVIAAYVAGGFDFIALRLAPGQGVQAMQPVRVVMPGAGLSLPLRMVAAGVGASVGITLYVISDGRYQAQNFPNGVVDGSKLVWLHAQAESNYESFAEQIMQGSGGRTWLTEFSQLTSLYGTPSSISSSGNYSCGSPGAGGSVSSFGNPTLPSLYYGQCLCQTTGSACVDGTDAEATREAGEAAGDDAASCTPCGAFDDLQVASVGLDPESTWLTRMRAILPSTALSTDLAIEAASPQSTVSNQYTASVYDDPTYDPCTASSAAGGNGGNGGGGCSAVDTSPMISGRELAAGSLVMLWAAGLRRRWQRRQRAG
jgi:hypothetical protein